METLPTNNNLYYLLSIQKELTEGANSAYKKRSFKKRNSIMAKAVSFEAAKLAAIPYSDLSDTTEKILFDFFLNATRKAGMLFKDSFDSQGNPIKNNKAKYENAVKNAGKIALDYLPKVVNEINNYIFSDNKPIDQNAITQIVKSATFNDMVVIIEKILSRWGILREKDIEQLNINELSPEQIKDKLRNIISNEDYFYGNIENISFAESGQKSEEEKIKILELAIRLANATWKVGQVHRAAWEENDDRINPKKREVFNPLDLLIINKFENVFSKTSSRTDAILIAAFEIWKDMVQLMAQLKEN